MTLSGRIPGWRQVLPFPTWVSPGVPRPRRLGAAGAKAGARGGAGGQTLKPLSSIGLPGTPLCSFQRCGQLSALIETYFPKALFIDGISNALRFELARTVTTSHLCGDLFAPGYRAVCAPGWSPGGGGASSGLAHRAVQAEKAGVLPTPSCSLNSGLSGARGTPSPFIGSSL